MKVKIGFLIVFMTLSGLISHLPAQSLQTQPGLVLSPTLLDYDWSSQEGIWDRKKKRKKKKILEERHKTLAVGFVGGDPLGFGARGIIRFGQIGASVDFAYNRIRDEDGNRLGAMGMKTDFRIYSKGLLAKLIRPYTFIGVTTHRALFNGEKYQSVYLADGGFGAGVKLFRLEIGAEAGVLIPMKQIDLYRPGIGAFVNANVVMWLF